MPTPAMITGGMDAKVGVIVFVADGSRCGGRRDLCIVLPRARKSRCNNA